MTEITAKVLFGGGRVHVTDGRNIEPGFSAGIAAGVC